MASWTNLFPFQSHYLPLGGARLHYIDEGTGRPLLFLHGNPTWSFYWRELISRYRTTHHVVAPDHIGSGLSDKPESYPYSLEQHSDNLLQLIEALDLQDITMLVHDWGGAIGLRAAVACRERISRIVLFNTGAYPPARVPWRIAACRTPVLGQLLVRAANIFSRAAKRMATGRSGGLAPDVQTGLIAPYDSWQNRCGVWGFIRDIPLSKRHPTYATLEQLERDLPGLADLPSVAIWGMRDWCFDDKCLQRFADIWPDMEIHRLADAGHWVVEDAPEQIMAILDKFLDCRERFEANKANVRA